MTVRKTKLKKAKNCGNCGKPKMRLFGLIYHFSNCPHKDVLQENWEIIIGEGTKNVERLDTHWFVSHVCSAWEETETPQSNFI